MVKTKPGTTLLPQSIYPRESTPEACSLGSIVASSLAVDAATMLGMHRRNQGAIWCWCWNIPSCLLHLMYIGRAAIDAMAPKHAQNRQMIRNISASNGIVVISIKPEKFATVARSDSGTRYTYCINENKSIADPCCLPCGVIAKHLETRRRANTESTIKNIARPVNEIAVTASICQLPATNLLSCKRVSGFVSFSVSEVRMYALHSCENELGAIDSASQSALALSSTISAL
ncbi:hypothetical protein FB639_000744 [Coemansia asiatica]|nr:hypothetical protein FB639_000744 [Coemansia asiatica]